MELSVIIVSYNVKYFLQLCLNTVLESLEGIDGEVIVVDNASIDGSAAFLQAHYPNIKRIKNKKNKGFAVANNQAIAIAKGEFILLLNPDTIVQKDTFAKCLSFMKEHPDAGALGAKMIDGSGRFLPESKRSFPTPAVAFYKLFGLAKCFPKSKKFGEYHLSYLAENAVHKVDVLSGAFMFLRKAALTQTGLLDEQFFMYGEDIDLSYRIRQAGYENYYFPETSIVHFKGESTRKEKLHYINRFYTAMALFARKHYKAQKATVFAAGLQAGIWARALLAVASQFLKKGGWLLLEIMGLFVALFAIKAVWTTVNPLLANYSTPEAMRNFSIYIFIWLTAVWLLGGYDWPFKLRKLLSGVMAGTLAVAAVYGLLPNAMRFSRAVIIFGAVAVFTILFLIRTIRHYKTYNTLVLGKATEMDMAIIGNKEEGNRVLNLLRDLNIPFHFFGFISPQKSNSYSIGSIAEVEAIAKNLHLNELIFCGKDVDAATMLNCMETLQKQGLQFKMVSAEGKQIVGSHSPDSEGDLYSFETVLAIRTPQGKRSKRIFDFFTALGGMLFSPVLCFFQHNPRRYFQNCFNVLLGKKSLVGYCTTEPSGTLPEIKPGILCPLSHLTGKYLSTEVLERFNRNYAQHYTPSTDMAILLKNWRRLGN